MSLYGPHWGDYLLVGVRVYCHRISPEGVSLSCKRGATNGRSRERVFKRPTLLSSDLFILL